ncbi:MAG: aconitase family protein [bacterium]
MAKRRKIPTKTELVQLQKLYRTDEKIGERLGGVPAYLIAYWRRKKNVPKHSQPKFSEKEINGLWERYGDDDRCGLELGISKAAFYNWRRRYGIKEKPAFLKLEQLELNFPGMKPSANAASLWNKQTVVQKILARTSSLTKVEVGQRLAVEPDLVLAGGASAQVIGRFEAGGGEYVWNTAKIILSADPDSYAAADRAGDLRLAVREFSGRQRIKQLYSRSAGALGQVVLEHGRVLPGQLILGVGAGVAAFGCMAGFGTRVSPETLAEVWIGGTTTIDVPASVRIDISGRRPRGVYARDIALSIVKRLQDEPVAGCVIEFYGSAISQMTIGERFALTGLMPSVGAAGAICQFDSNTRRYLMGRAQTTLEPIVSDKNATYDGHYQVNIDQLFPQIAGPNSLKEIKPVSQVEGVPVHLVMIGGETAGRFDDLRFAADILKGRRINPECRLLIHPASHTVYLEALKKGIIRVFAEAGAVVVPTGCCSEELPPWMRLGPTERCLSTDNETDPAAFGEPSSEVFLCSPATAAASAINAAITDPIRYGK